jgi:protein-disulfide isomerase
MNKQLTVVLAAVVLIAVFVAAAMKYRTQQADQLSNAAYENASLLERDYSPRKGDPDAKVTIVEFFDPACGTCRSFYPFVEQLISRHPGQVKLVLRYTPFHNGSDAVVRMLEAARLQGKFFEALEAAYAAQPGWVANHQAQPDRLWVYLDKAGIDLEQAREDMHREDIEDRIRQDVSDARQLQVTKTPGFFVNGRPLVPFGADELRALVDSEVARNY